MPTRQQAGASRCRRVRGRRRRPSSA